MTAIMVAGVPEPERGGPVSRAIPARVAEFLVMLGVVALAAGCPRDPGTGDCVKAGENKTVQARSNGKDVVLLPFLQESGIPVVCLRDASGAVDGSPLFSHPVGIPFGHGDSNLPVGAELLMPSPPRVAIWRDGTVIWSMSETEGKVSCYEGTLTSQVVENLLKQIEGVYRRRRTNSTYSKQLRVELGLPSSVITVADGKNSFVFCSDLDQMERANLYWDRTDGQFRDYPRTEYSFAQFSERIPVTFKEYLESYIQIRDELRAAVPPEGRQIDTTRVRWVIVPVTGLGVIAPEKPSWGATKRDSE